ncbi:MAG: hypothetical protein HZB55_19345 [Deltaproteobacteria bacterium]|nr:hypothetical protein [Deltaproteobacteria bacterium]
MRRAAALVYAVLVSAALAAGAQQAPSAAVPAPPPPPSEAPSAAEPLAVQMKEVEIRGEVERPEVFYIIPRREARMDLSPLSKNYRDEIAEPLLPGPFEERVHRGEPNQP